MRSRWWRYSLCVSLAVLMIVGILWLRGLYVRDRVTTTLVGRKLRIENFPHHVFIVYGTPGPDVGEQVTFALELRVERIESQPRFWEVRYRRMRGGFVGIGIPYWLVLLLASAFPIYWLHLKFTQRVRHRRGMCPTCGYDLRATTDRCPECGEPISTSTPAASAS